MTIIKGGVTIRPNSDNIEFMDKLDKAGVKIKIPFTATGFKSSKMPRCVDLAGIELKDTKVKGVVDVKGSVKPITKTIKSVFKKKSKTNRR